MKQERHTTEEIIRILREADAAKDLETVYRKHNISAPSFYRWKKKFGDLELKDARKYRQLEKENSELKQMRADGLLKTRDLEEVNSKKDEPFAETASRPGRGKRWALLGAKGLSLPGAASFQSSPFTPRRPSDWLLRLHAPDRDALPQAPAPGLPQAGSPPAQRRLAGGMQAKCSASGASTGCGSGGGPSGPGGGVAPPARSRLVILRQVLCAWRSFTASPRREHRETGKIVKNHRQNDCCR